jgi:hypothetical protein
MSSFYDELAATAREVIADFGAAASLSQRVTVYNPATGAGTVATTTVAVTCVVFDYERKFVDGTTILNGDKQCFMSVVAGAEPKAGDRLTWQGVSHAVVHVKKLAPAGISVLYELQVRQ